MFVLFILFIFKIYFIFKKKKEYFKNVPYNFFYVRKNKKKKIKQYFSFLYKFELSFITHSIESQLK